MWRKAASPPRRPLPAPGMPSGAPGGAGASADSGASARGTGQGLGTAGGGTGPGQGPQNIPKSMDPSPLGISGISCAQGRLQPPPHSPESALPQPGLGDGRGAIPEPSPKMSQARSGHGAPGTGTESPGMGTDPSRMGMELLGWTLGWVRSLWGSPWDEHGAPGHRCGPRASRRPADPGLFPTISLARVIFRSIWGSGRGHRGFPGDESIHGLC